MFFERHSAGDRGRSAETVGRTSTRGTVRSPLREQQWRRHQRSPRVVSHRRRRASHLVSSLGEVVSDRARVRMGGGRRCFGVSARRRGRCNAKSAQGDLEPLLVTVGAAPQRPRLDRRRCPASSPQDPLVLAWRERKVSQPRPEDEHLQGEDAERELVRGARAGRPYGGCRWV